MCRPMHHSTHRYFREAYCGRARRIKRSLRGPPRRVRGDHLAHVRASSPDADEEPAATTAPEKAPRRFLSTTLAKISVA